MNRRKFLHSSAAASLSPLFTAALPRLVKADVLSGYDGSPEAGHTVLNVDKRTIEVNGKAASVFKVERPDGRRGLEFTAGDQFDVILKNRTGEPTIVHWHGLTPPWPADGVGGAPLALIEGGADRHFHFPVDRAGTNWMHAHTLQEQDLLAAPLIVRDPGDKSRDEQEVVILLHDFSFKAPEEILAYLKKNSKMPSNASGETGAEADSGMKMDNSMSGMKMGGDDADDINDFDYDAYLANDRTLDDPEVVAIEDNARVRLRIINGATATAFTIDLGEVEGTLIAVDGHDVQPVAGRRFPISMGQRLDIRLTAPRGSAALPILALREGAPERTGIILQPKGKQVGKIPAKGMDNGPVLDLSLESGLRASAPLAVREATRRYEIALTGGMQGYAWGMTPDSAIAAAKGDRVELLIRNRTMMAHPIHLHGHSFQVVGIGDRPRFSGAVRDTVLLPPNEKVTVAVDAGNPGQWAFHCHHLYHMAAGMITVFGYPEA
ncbi:MAG: multicopper oxidase family protein [Rhizobiales bacterium]|nr:multicopper oxidase family protein [Hyphomicrobiales bacterium]MBI3673302.1 multicopper oxidase family protein [Hyphomicrobiales bacterium]